MLFGADTPDVLETKLNNLEEQITDADETVKTTKEELRWSFVTLSLYLASYWLNCIDLSSGFLPDGRPGDLWICSHELALENILEAHFSSCIKACLSSISFLDYVKLIVRA